MVESVLKSGAHGVLVRLRTGQLHWDTKIHHGARAERYFPVSGTGFLSRANFHVFIARGEGEKVRFAQSVQFFLRTLYCVIQKVKIIIHMRFFPRLFPGHDDDRQ